MKVVVLDAWALHLGFLGCYGNEWVDTPHLDRLAAEAVVFDQHYADTPGTRPDDRTCWTGRYGFPGPDETEAAPEARPRLAGLLEAGGIAAAFVSFDEFHAGLDRLAENENWLLWIDLPTLAPPWDVPGEYLALYFDEEPDEEDEEPLLPWTDPPCGPLNEADDRAMERLQNSYAAAVSYLDAGVGQLLEELDERGLTNQVMVCFTADRGLALGEHGVVGECRPWPHEEFLHLPLIIRPPGGVEAGRRVFALTQPVDLLPTLLEAFGLPIPAWAQGHGLGPLLRDQLGQVRAYACAGLRVGEDVEWALRTSDWGFILPIGPGPRGPQLYVKPNDRWEVNNVLQHHLDLADHLEQTLRGFVATTRRPGPLQPPELRDVEAEATAPAETSPSGGQP